MIIVFKCSLQNGEEIESTYYLSTYFNGMEVAKSCFMIYLVLSKSKAIGITDRIH
jgi:hypothetical protein